MKSPIERRRLAVLAVLPELSTSSMIPLIGQFLAKNGFVIHSASFLKGTRELVDLLYLNGPSNKQDRLHKINRTFASYSEYLNGPVGLVLLRRAGYEAGRSATDALNEIKGKSQGPQPGSLRALFPNSRHWFAYVHVPDEEMLGTIISVYFPPTEDLRQSTAAESSALWTMMGDISTDESTPLGREDLIRIIIRKCLQIVQMSRIDYLMESARVAQMHFSSGNYSGLSDTLTWLYARISRESFAERRLSVMAQVAMVLLEWQMSEAFRSEILNAITTELILSYCGITLSKSNSQLLQSFMLA